jgi:hypothetical protein
VVGRLAKHNSYRKRIAEDKMVYSRWYHILLGSGDAICQLSPASLKLNSRTFS